MSLGHVWFLRGVGNSLTPPSDRVGNSLLDASATMNAYDSIERGVVDEGERRRPRTFTLTQLLVACGAVCVCAIGATMFVNTRLETTPSLGQTWGTPGVLWKWTPACKTKQEALKKDLMSCNADLKSKIKTAARTGAIDQRRHGYTDHRPPVFAVCFAVPQSRRKSSKSSKKSSVPEGIQWEFLFFTTPQKK